MRFYIDQMFWNGERKEKEKYLRTLAKNNALKCWTSNLIVWFIFLTRAYVDCDEARWGFRKWSAGKRSRDFPAIARKSVECRRHQGERDRESISEIKNNCYGERGNRTNSAVPGRRGNLMMTVFWSPVLLLFRESSVFRHPQGIRALHVYQREGRCHVLVASLIVAVIVVFPRK